MSLFERLVATSGLSPVFARSSLTRALQRLNLKPETLSPADIKSALSELEKVLGMFLQKDEVSRRLLDIQRLTR